MSFEQMALDCAEPGTPAIVIRRVVEALGVAYRIGRRELMKEGELFQCINCEEIEREEHSYPVGDHEFACKPCFEEIQAELKAERAAADEAKAALEEERGGEL